MKKTVLMILSAVLLFGACSVNSPAGSSAQSSSKVQPISYKAALKQQPIKTLDSGFVSAINTFGFKTTGTLYGTGENLALSPVSIELALAMTRTGAAGDTAKEMANALSLEGLSDEQIEKACKSLMWRANTGGMKAANSIWVDESYPFSKDFISGCTDNFMADVEPLVIPGAMDSINKWASDNTKGKIDKIISQELDPLTRMVLCNALYFLGDWETPFEANDTFDDQFTAPGGAVTASFMHAQWGTSYYENDKFQIISLPFKSKDGEGKYAMAFILPEEGTSLGDTLSSLTAGDFSGALSGLDTKQVNISLPKFKFSYYTALNDTLKSLGMKTAFTDEADFSGMTGSDNDLYISDVLHKCYIRVDELGAEAAAVTAVIMKATAVMPTETVEFNANRPFAFAIYSTEDGTIAFMGAVNDPTAAGNS
jgi:serine protease inhibitor